MCGGRTRWDGQGDWWQKEGSLLKFLPDFFPWLPVCLTDDIFHQSAAWPPSAAPAQTSKPLTVLFLATTAAAANAQMHLGSVLLVSLTRPLEPDSGRCYHPALQTAVAARVSDMETIIESVPFVEFNLKDYLPQVLSRRQTTPATTLSTTTRRREYK